MKPSRLLVLAAALLLAAGCATNPVTGRRELSLVSSNRELQLGREGYPAVVEEYGKYDDAALAAYVDSVGQRVARASHLPGLEWHFTVLDDPTVNAFAMPGGYIYITRGILSHLNSEAQLAGVLGHEIGHVTHRHTAEQMTQQQLVGLGYTALQIAAPELQQYDAMAQQALGLIFLKYSRAHETEADELGVSYATAAGYDPHEIPPTYAMLKRVSQAAGSNIPPFMSTHPDPGDREARTSQLADQASAGKSGLRVAQRDYLRHLEGVVYGFDPRQGYFTGSRYYQPTLDFQVDFPSAWKQQDSRSAVLAGEPAQRGVVQLTLAKGGDASPAAFAQSLLTSGQALSVQGRGERIGGFDAWVGRLGVNGQSGPTRLDAAFIRVSPQTMFQFLGASTVPGDAVDDAIFQCMRSFRSIEDRSKLAAAPARVHLASAPSAGTLRALLPALGPSGITADELAVVNNLDLDESLLAGKTLKLVRPGTAH
ncbi:MAG: M48 family metalloprotease [Candidatus Eiseniibacteriota bacterium]